jgi:glycosyltransferase involved in cell wall biosynthesis
LTRVLIVTGDRIAEAMAGPAIRCWEMARLLSQNGHEVRVAAGEGSTVGEQGFEVIAPPRDALALEATLADVIVVQGVVTAIYPFLLMPGKRIVVDLYDPYNLEILELFHDHPMEDRLGQHQGHLGALLAQLVRGDFFLCASEKQRDYWLGMLSAMGRINPYTHGDDRLLRRLIDTASFGISSAGPVAASRPVVKGVLPGIEADARVVVWGGGVYNWFDPLSLIRAWPRILEREPRARLLFMGMRHPNPDVPEMDMAVRALRLSEELDLRDKTVHFNMQWVPYEKRQEYLLEADLGVSTHFNHVETSFSFRTRILDYIWAGLPVVSTEGDEFARWIIEHRTGKVVRFEDPDSIATAIADLLTDENLYRACVKAVQESRAPFVWDRALAPLVTYCEAPWRAADLFAEAPEALEAATYMTGSMLAPKGLLPRTRWFLEHEGARGLARRLVRTARRRIGRALAGTTL